MAQSPLLGADRAPRRQQATSTESLGPSDISDSGSDLVGAAGAVDTDALGLDGGTNDDVRRAPGAGADIGDANLDADSDSGGTGERAEAGRDTLQVDAPDISPDHVEGIGSDEALVADDDDDTLMADADTEADAEDEGEGEGDDDDRGRGVRAAGPIARRSGERWPERPQAKGEPKNDPVPERDKAIDA
jgi:hypothetical protein